MPIPEIAAEISALEEQLSLKKILLDKAFSDNLQFSETKIIFHQMKIISEKLENLKSTLTNTN